MFYFYMDLNMSSIFTSLPTWLISSLLLVISVFALTIILERFWVLFRNLTPISSEIKNFILNSKILEQKEEILRKISRKQHPALSTLEVLLEANITSKTDLSSIAEENMYREQASLEKYISTLSTISTISPLLGLLGTVTGMIKSFGAFGLQQTSQNNQLTGGIDEALITTALGLLVSIPCLIAYNYFVKRIDFLLNESRFFLERVLKKLEK